VLIWSAPSRRVPAEGCIWSGQDSPTNGVCRIVFHCINAGGQSREKTVSLLPQWSRNERKKPVAELAEGQLWRIRGGFVRIGHVGKSLVHYKMMNSPERRAVPVRISSIHEVQNFLQQKTCGAGRGGCRGQIGAGYLSQNPALRRFWPGGFGARSGSLSVPSVLPASRSMSQRFGKTVGVFAASPKARDRCW